MTLNFINIKLLSNIPILPPPQLLTVADPMFGSMERERSERERVQWVNY